MKRKWKCFAKRKQNTNVNQRASNVIVIETKLISQRKLLHKMFSKIWHLIASIWWFGDNWQHSIMTLASLCWCRSRSPSTCATMESWKSTLINTYTNFGHICQKKMPSPSEADSPSTDFHTGQRTCSCTCITGLGGTCFLCVDGLQLDTETDCLEILEMRVFLKLNENLVWVGLFDWVKRKLI